MKCRQVREELIFLFADNELGGELLVSYRQHVSTCPHCARIEAETRLMLELIRQRRLRLAAPRRLRSKILAGLPHRRTPNRRTLI
ncbi:MAG: zf-HC2 domain-containing protein [Acidobacteriota bacterium]